MDNLPGLFPSPPLSSFLLQPSWHRRISGIDIMKVVMTVEESLHSNYLPTPGYLRQVSEGSRQRVWDRDSTLRLIFGRLSTWAELTSRSKKQGLHRGWVAVYTLYITPGVDKPWTTRRMGYKWVRKSLAMESHSIKEYRDFKSFPGPHRRLTPKDLSLPCSNHGCMRNLA